MLLHRNTPVPFLTEYLVRVETLTWKTSVNPICSTVCLFVKLIIICMNFLVWGKNQQNWMLRSKTCYRMELRFSSTTSRDRPGSILLHPDDGVDHVLLRGEHLLLLLVAKVLLQVKSPPVASLAPSSTVPAWHLLALLPSCSLQIISEESDAETLYWCVYINDPARSSGIIHLSLYTLPFGDSHLGTPSDWDVCEMSVPSGETLIFVYTNCHFCFINV